MKDSDATFTPDYQTFKSYKKNELNQWLRLVEECYGTTLNFELDTTGSLLLASLSHGEATLKRMLVDFGVADANSFYSILYSLMQIQSTSKSIVKTNTTETSEPPVFKNFLRWLELSGIKRPDEDVLNRIVEKYAMRCNLVANEKMARALYEDAQRYPGSTIQESIQKQLHIKLDGPLPTADTNSPDAVLLSGMNDKTKGAIVVKVLLHSDPSTQKEIDHINLLKFGTQQAIGIIEAETHQVQVNRREHGMPNVTSDVFNCILMPRYVLTVAEAAGLMTEEAVYDGALRMCQALAHIHKCGLVHMDVKPANIFMDVAGNWFLGDFGSSVKQGANVESTSTPYLPMNCIQKPSRVEFDYFMLGVTLVTALGVQVKDLQQNGIMLADAEKVKSAAEKVQNEKLKRLIFDSINKLLHAEP